MQVPSTFRGMIMKYLVDMQFATITWGISWPTKAVNKLKCASIRFLYKKASVNAAMNYKIEKLFLYKKCILVTKSSRYFSVCKMLMEVLQPLQHHSNDGMYKTKP